ncbi:MAG: NTP transferase domain-containing protein [Vicinamibacterales bacterium]
MKCVATIEARMTSSRLPGKVLMTAAGKPMLRILIERLRTVPRLDAIVVATTVNATDDPIAGLGAELGVQVFRGSEDDVLGRVCGALDATGADVCVEITGDCPLVDPAIVGEAIDEYFRTRDTHWYISNSDPHRAVPAGLDVQVFGADLLRQLERVTHDPEEREHVSYGFYRPEAGDRWRPRFIRHEAARGAEGLLVTLDYREDYELIRALYEDLHTGSPLFGVTSIVNWIRAHPEAHARCLQVRGLTAA